MVSSSADKGFSDSEVGPAASDKFGGSVSMEI
jgi:hypothetical protein